MTTNILYSKSNYINKMVASTTSMIREYDMVDAGFSIIQEYSLLPPEKILELSKLPKKEKNIAIGKLNGCDKILSRKFHSSFELARKIFFELNEVEEDEVLSIKRDAIFLKNKIARHNKIGKFINFKLKNKFTSFMNLNGIECYFNSYSNILTVKNIGSNVFKFEKGIIPLISEYMTIKEKLGKTSNNSVYLKLLDFRADYVNLRLPKEYYREFDRDAMYRMNAYEFGSEEIGDFSLEHLDISHNYMNVLVPLIKVFI